MGDDEASEEKKPDANALSLKVVTQQPDQTPRAAVPFLPRCAADHFCAKSQDGNEIFFKCKLTTPLQKLMTVRALTRLLRDSLSLSRRCSHSPVLSPCRPSATATASR